ncbi:MFS transporter [Sphingomonas adhaesiva]|uniref:MFS transporter n=1 Tax=Sphingomonas adhaesiva TaxID=28212 RepID=UPI002FF912D7
MEPSSARAPWRAIVVAALACLQPGIDPVFLTLLSQAGGLPAQTHGWIVGATQGGMAIGALLVWRRRPFLPRRASLFAALVAIVAAIATGVARDLAAMLAIRATFGVAMGIVYTEAMGAAAATHPTRSYATVFLSQLLLSTVTALALPTLSHAAGARATLLALALVPLVVALLVAGAPSVVREEAPRGVARATSPIAWALALATFAFICATMMVWSSAGALATDHGFDAGAIGVAVAIGSITGAATALAMMRERRRWPLPLTGLAASACLLAPLVLTPLGDRTLFVGAIVLLNIGSTAIIIRCSGAAAAASDDAVFRRFVACTHPLGMIAGPLAGAGLTALAGVSGLAGGALASLACGCGALLVGAGAPSLSRYPEKTRSAA